MPEDFRPRPYQTYAIKRIEETPNLALMLDMGMGKTVATLTAIQSLLYDSFEVRRVLVIAPLHVAETTWADECSTWNHLKDMRVEPVLGNLKKRIAALHRHADVYTINRENVVWLVKYYGADWPFDMVVIDESSSFKNPQAKRFRALRKVRAKIQRLVELTGTPAPNGLIWTSGASFIFSTGANGLELPSGSTGESGSCRGREGTLWFTNGFRSPELTRQSTKPYPISASA